MKSIITILVAIALVGCNSSTDDTPYTPEAIVEFDLPPQKIQKNHTGYFANENLKIKALVKQGQIASFNWRANESDINLINSHTDTISFTTPLVTGYSDLHQPGVIRTIYLDLIDTVNRKQTLELKIRLFPVIKDVSFDEELINLGFTDEDIDSLCSTPTPDNGNYYNVKDSSVHCLVSKGEAIIRFNHEYTVVYSSSSSSAYSLTERADFTELNFKTNKIIFSGDRLYKINDGFTYSSINSPSSHMKYGSLTNTNIIDNNHTIKNSHYRTQSHSTYSNNDYSHNQIWVEADSNSIASFNLASINISNKDLNVTIPSEHVNPMSHMRWDLNKRIKLFIKNWE